MISLPESYRHCQRVARQRAKNFYYSFYALPREKRDAMCTLYAFFRFCDDLSDHVPSVETARANLHRWRAVLEEAYAGQEKAGVSDATGDLAS
ncbi:MAG: hypothetical protein FJ388_23825, partial [Verrucomicrobia bacterium]|nr:hypothetical protein [Verrucomicrobiota bacterium]